jgi:hypothetical protein
MDLTKYVSYIKNTGKVPLPIEMFDDDWEPIGPTVRGLLVGSGLATQDASGIRLVEKT